MIAAVIFDLDEVLVDNFSCHKKSTDTVLRRYVDGPFLKEDGDPIYIGMRVSDMVKDLMTIHHIPDHLFEKIYTERQRHFLDLVQKNGRAMPGVAEAIELATNLHLKKAIASSGSIDYITLCLNQLNLSMSFDGIVSGEEL